MIVANLLFQLTICKQQVPPQSFTALQRFSTLALQHSSTQASHTRHFHSCLPQLSIVHRSIVYRPGFSTILSTLSDRQQFSLWFLCFSAQRLVFAAPFLYCIVLRCILPVDQRRARTQPLLHLDPCWVFEASSLPCHTTSSRPDCIVQPASLSAIPSVICP